MWLVYSFVILTMWSVYAIYGERATSVHGPWVSMAIEALVMAIMAAVAAFIGRADFAKITGKSLFDGSIMAITSAGGFLLLLIAMAAYPGKTGPMLLIAGLYPVTMVVVLRLFYGGTMAPHQWVAAIGAGVCMAIFNWPK